MVNDGKSMKMPPLFFLMAYIAVQWYNALHYFTSSVVTNSNHLNEVEILRSIKYKHSKTSYFVSY